MISTEALRIEKNRKLDPPRTNDPLLLEVFRRIDEKGLSYTKLCNRAGVTIAAVGQWRKGVASPRLSLLVPFMEAAGLRLRIEDMEEPGE